MPQMLTNDSNQNVMLVNKWVAEKTNGKITHLVDEVDPSTMLVLLNAVYFNSKCYSVISYLLIYEGFRCVPLCVPLCRTGKWKMIFESMNKQAEFTKFSGEVKKVFALFSSKYKLAMSYNKKIKAQVSVTTIHKCRK